MQTTYDSVYRDYLFPTFLYSFTPQVCLEAVLAEITSIKEAENGVQFTNRGGWQTKDRPFRLGDPEVREVDKLLSQSLSFARDLVYPSERLRGESSVVSWWANFNGFNNSNVVHAHGGANLSGVFYVKTPEDCGDIIFVRGSDNAANIHTNDHISFRVRPTEGRLYVFPSYLLHFVEANLSQESRISIALNYHTS